MLVPQRVLTLFEAPLVTLFEVGSPVPVPQWCRESGNRNRETAFEIKTLSVT
jgi:hypothetical protein